MLAYVLRPRYIPARTPSPPSHMHIRIHLGEKRLGSLWNFKYPSFSNESKKSTAPHFRAVVHSTSIWWKAGFSSPIQSWNVLLATFTINLEDINHIPILVAKLDGVSHRMSVQVQACQPMDPVPWAPTDGSALSSIMWVPRLHNQRCGTHKCLLLLLVHN